VEIALVDDLKPGDVVVLACNGPTDRIAPWGELLSTAATARGAAGCVIDGLVRDVRQIREMRFPVFHGGIAPLDSKGRGKVAEIDVPIRCSGVRVNPGDLVVGDADGVVVVPAAIAAEVMRDAAEQDRMEAFLRRKVEAGASIDGVYPPDDATKAEYRAWLERQEP